MLPELERDVMERVIRRARPYIDEGFARLAPDVVTWAQHEAAHGRLDIAITVHRTGPEQRTTWLHFMAGAPPVCLVAIEGPNVGIVVNGGDLFELSAWYYPDPLLDDDLEGEIRLPVT